MNLEELKKYIGHSNFTVVQVITTLSNSEWLVKEDGNVYPYIIVQSKQKPFIYQRRPYVAKKHI